MSDGSIAGFDRYEDQGRLGQGGLATVDLVRDRDLRREVAMKRLEPELAKRPDMVQSFVEEAQLSSQLEHPNILPVHEIGTDPAGDRYFTMRVVRGNTLWALLYDPEKPLGSAERLAELLEIFFKVCDAVAYAHSRGVVHRDIKPHNIMVGPFGEVYMMDWGLAKVERGDAPGLVDVPRMEGSPLANSREGAVGTPSYMAPEQASGDQSRVDPRTDVFALGALLYHIVTGELPYRGSSAKEVLAAAKGYKLTPPDEIPGVFVQKKMARVIMTAMAKEPSDRFQTVNELKTTVQRFLRGGLHLPRKTFMPGERLVEEGTAGDAAYIITRGECEVYKTVAGQRQVKRRIGVGSVLGELAVISSAPRTATVEAIDRVTVLVLTRELLEEGFAADTWEGLLVKSLVDRFRELDARLTELAVSALNGFEHDARTPR